MTIPRWLLILLPLWLVAAFAFGFSAGAQYCLHELQPASPSAFNLELSHQHLRADPDERTPRVRARHVPGEL